MASFWESLLNHTFLQYALLGAVLASIGCGVVGSFVVVKRIGYLAGGIAHAVLGGMGVAYYLGKDPLIGALLAALIAALLIGWVHLKFSQQEDTIISALWAIGMAVGIVFISKTPGYNVDLMSYLFGNVLMIAKQDLYMMAVLDILISTIILVYYKQFLAVSMDEEFAELRGVNVELFYLLLLSMVALTVVLLIQVVGLILVIALLTLPAAIAGQYVRSVGKMIIWGSLIGILFSSFGLFLSYQTDLPAGSTIILLAGAAYLCSTLFSSFLQRKKQRSVK